MDRLTRRTSQGDIAFYDDSVAVYDLMQRLASYEDTNMSPEEAKKAKRSWTA